MADSYMDGIVYSYMWQLFVLYAYIVATTYRLHDVCTHIHIHTCTNTIAVYATETPLPPVADYCKQLIRTRTT